MGGDITVLLKQEYDHVQTELGEIINASGISNCDDAIADVWNEYNPRQVPDIKSCKYQNSLLTDDDRNLIMSRMFKYKRQEEVPEESLPVKRMVS